MLDKIRGQSDANYNYRSPETRYVDHLMSFYWRGTISLNDELIVRLFRESDIRLRKEAISFVGRALESDKSVVPPEIIERLQALMDFRFAELRASKDPKEREELTEFGWWFVSGRFDAAWALTKIQEVLGLCDDIHPDHLVMDFLKDQASSHPDLVADCLRLLIQKVSRRPNSYGWLYRIEEVFAELLASESKSAKQKTVDLIHELGARGYQNLASLLDNIETEGQPGT
jgi:hypothetical protein